MKNTIKYFKVIITIMILLTSLVGCTNTNLPKGFVYVTDVVPDAILEMRYYSTYNFVGKRIDRYLAPVAILTEEAAQALSKANEDLRQQGYAIKIFDAYRPQDAVDHFIRWAKDDKDTLMKEYFYPDIEKELIVTDKYIKERSTHSRGSTVDITLIDMRTGQELDMGSSFDLFGPVSNPETKLITSKQAANRVILRNYMEKAGFTISEVEWWHFTLNNEPYPDKYFNFYVR